MSETTPAFSRDPRCHMLAVVLMAGYALRAMNRLRRALPGGLNAAHILLDVLLADRKARLDVAGARIPGGATAAHSILAISAAVEVPRETVRRNLVALTADGWLDHTAAGGYLPSARTRHGFTVHEDVSGLAEFIWIAGQVKATLSAADAEIDAMVARHAWHVALATQEESLPHPPYREAIAPLAARLSVTDAPSRERAANVVDGYLYRHMLRLRQAFDGDLLLPVMIGEIAHRNISTLAHRADPTAEVGQMSGRFATPRTEQPLALAPVNAYSLSLSMGIPDATVRRKVAYLCRRGWITVAQDGVLHVAGTVRTHSAALNDESLADMMAGHRSLCGLGVVA